MWAHSAVQRGGPRHRLRDHAVGTGLLGAEFARPWGGAALVAALGLFHDAGKAWCAWQDRLEVVEDTGLSVGLDHKTVGARLLARAADYAVMAIVGHHGGLDSLEGVRSLLRSPVPDHYADTVGRFYGELPEARQIAESGACLVPDAWLTDPLLGEVGLRLAFSALVDADRLDTARFRSGAHAALACRADADFAALVDRFEKGRLELLDGSASRAAMSQVRSEVYEAACAASQWPRGIYRLTAPTGSGKTLAQAVFGLRHAAKQGLRRVVVAVPFISVTEQNARVYRKLLDTQEDQVVLEHHSQTALTGDGSGRRWAALGAENWDAPFVVTTTVQLFQSLFGRRPEQMRKLHRLAGAAIVLDEVHALPPRLLLPILDVLKRLVTNFGSTVLLTSATQPAWESLTPWQHIPVKPVISDPGGLFVRAERAARIRLRWEKANPVSLETLARRVAEHEQALVVVNTTRDARRLAQSPELRARGVGHLSTRMCPLHRQDVLDRAKMALISPTPLPLLLVSTQLIECGVDIGFPLVYREYSPAESLHQAAGRANRDGELDYGTVVVFSLRDGTPPPRAYTVPMDRTDHHFAVDHHGLLTDPDRFTAYCADVYHKLGLNGTDTIRPTNRPVGRRIQDARAECDFPMVARLFRMIEDEDTRPVVVRYGDEIQRAQRDRLVHQARTRPERMRVWRELQPWIVTLAARQVSAALASGDAREIIGDLVEWIGPYDPVVGIVAETPSRAPS